MDRGIFDHPLFAERRAYSRLEAWLWLVAEASWKERPRDLAGKVVRLRRGQLAHSVRFMGEAWGWHRAKVERFLDRLKTETMIETATETGLSILTICNYNAYQRVGLPDRDTSRDTDQDTSETPPRRTRNIQTFKEEIKSETCVPDPTPKPSKRKVYPADFEGVWKAYPTTANMSKLEALGPWRKLSDEERSQVASSIPSYVAFLKKNPDHPVIHFCRYLTKRRWEGFVTATSSAGAGEPDWTKCLGWGRDHRTWSTSRWGPLPGEAGCRVPADMLLPGDGEGWTEFKPRLAAG